MFQDSGKMKKRRRDGHRGIVLFVMWFILVLSTHRVLGQESYRVLQYEIVVYRDGVSRVKSVIEVNSTVPSISLWLYGEAANVMVTDDRGQLLRHELARSSIVIYTVGASTVRMEYDTMALTRKDGPVWTLKIDLGAQGRIFLPDGAVVTYVTDRPASIEAVSGRPVLTLARGLWEISYVIPIHVTTTMSGTSVTTSVTSTPTVLTPSSAIIGAAIIVTVLLVVGLVMFLRRRSRFLSEPLSPADSEMLQLISSRGGRMFESELRDALGLPKTSVWRRVKKLEKVGLVRTRKVGSQNEVELAQGL